MPSLRYVLESKSLIFVTGKGGIGKTTLSLALAEFAVRLGRNVLLCEASARPQVCEMVGMSIPPQVEEQAFQRLRIVNLTSDGNFREYLSKYLLKAKVFEQIISNRVLTSFFNALPGLAEIMLLGRLYYSSQLSPERSDLIIMDSPASGHFLSLMTTPEAIIRSGLVGPLIRETRRVLDFLRNRHSCGTILVGTPEELVVTEMLEFAPKIQNETPVGLDYLIVNRDPTITIERYNHQDVQSFWTHKIEKATRAKDTLFNGLKQIPLLIEENSILSVPDLGFINEPVNESFYTALFGDHCHV